ncbi:MAG: hypothetical protein KAW89_02040 [Armatimonadetes bacterium]|nr:hypothetical protein [Armatimonadota bacterium]
MPSAILDRFCQKVSQIVQSQGTACFALSAADSRLYLQGAADLAPRDLLCPGLHVEIDDDSQFAAAAVQAIDTEAYVVLDSPLEMSDARVPGPAMVLPVIWEPEAVEPDEEAVKYPVGILVLWGKRGADTFDPADEHLAKALSKQAAALLVVEHQSIVASAQSPFSTAVAELVGHVAHEVRTPLTVIQGNLQTIERMVGDEITP